MIIITPIPIGFRAKLFPLKEKFPRSDYFFRASRSSRRDQVVTKILFIEEDLTSFEIRKCIAAVLEGISPVELYHAKDASEGLELLDEVKPDVIVIEHEERAEAELFLDGLNHNHPPIVVDVLETEASEERGERSVVTYLKHDGSLEGIHHLLKVAKSLAALGSVPTDVAQ